jgi:hypothetical protein
MNAVGRFLSNSHLSYIQIDGIPVTRYIKEKIRYFPVDDITSLLYVEKR